jgi:S1-C subfamily serine protease
MAILGIVFIFCAYMASALVVKQDKWAGSTVKIEQGHGHGSGVHIGRGMIMTAAHVVADATDVEIKTDLGKSMNGKVVWVSKDYDVAMISTDADHLSASRLSCQPLSVGQSVKAEGNPGILDFMSSWGRIASQEAPRGDWRSSVIVDITIAPGSSGGPLFDDQHRVVGIVVGAALTQVYGPVPGASVVPYSYVVPATAVCRMMAMA